MSLVFVESPVKATPVPEKMRLGFLPEQLGKHMLHGEMLVYHWMDVLSSDYQGGLWEFYTLSNDGFYIAPISDKTFRVNVDSNGFSGEMSANAAGIVASLFALCELANRFAEDRLINQYHWLRDFAIEHAESGLIMRAID